MLTRSEAPEFRERSLDRAHLDAPRVLRIEARPIEQNTTRRTPAPQLPSLDKAAEQLDGVRSRFHGTR